MALPIIGTTDHRNHPSLGIRDMTGNPDMVRQDIR